MYKQVIVGARRDAVLMMTGLFLPILKTLIVAVLSRLAFEYSQSLISFSYQMMLVIFVMGLIQQTRQ